jgi:hypothetical protein
VEYTLLALTELVSGAYPIIPQALFGTFSYKPLLDNCNNDKNNFIALGHIPYNSSERILA